MRLVLMLHLRTGQLHRQYISLAPIRLSRAVLEVASYLYQGCLPPARRSPAVSPQLSAISASQRGLGLDWLVSGK